MVNILSYCLEHSRFPAFFRHKRVVGQYADSHHIVEKRDRIKRNNAANRIKYDIRNYIAGCFGRIWVIFFFI